MLTKWLWVRVVLAVAVLVMVGVELSGHRPTAMVVVQAILIVGILATVVADLVAWRRRSVGSGTQA
jgi:hypothetical protein